MSAADPFRTLRVRVTPRRLLLRALAALYETADAAGNGPIEPSLGAHFALGFLYAVGRGHRADFDRFLSIVRGEAHENDTPAIADYCRGTHARTEIMCIARGCGVELMGPAYGEVQAIARRAAPGASPPAPQL